VDASTRGRGGFNLEWRRHRIEEHLEDYLANGPGRSGCWYSARSSSSWENEAFRQQGVAWLEENSGQCIAVGGGGTRRPGRRARIGH